MINRSILRETQSLAPIGAAAVRVGAFGTARLRTLLVRYGLRLVTVAHDTPIPASFWGDEEAGRRGDLLYVRADTPVHSVLHEAGHYVCMDARRRAAGAIDAAGTYAEENAVCYWQIVAADALVGMGRARMCADMDAWGYTFRLGSAAAWFDHDAEDARAWLAAAGVIEPRTEALTFTLRH